MVYLFIVCQPCVYVIQIVLCKYRKIYWIKEILTAFDYVRLIWNDQGSENGEVPLSWPIMWFMALASILDVKHEVESFLTSKMEAKARDLNTWMGGGAAPKNWGKAAAILVQSKSRCNCTTFNEGPMGYSRIWSK